MQTNIRTVVASMSRVAPVREMLPTTISVNTAAVVMIVLPPPRPATATTSNLPDNSSSKIHDRHNNSHCHCHFEQSSPPRNPYPHHCSRHRRPFRPHKNSHAGVSSSDARRPAWSPMAWHPAVLRPGLLWMSLSWPQTLNVSVW